MAAINSSVAPPRNYTLVYRHCSDILLLPMRPSREAGPISPNFDTDRIALEIPINDVGVGGRGVRYTLEACRLSGEPPTAGSLQPWQFPALGYRSRRLPYSEYLNGPLCSWSELRFANLRALNGYTDILPLRV